MTFPRPFLTAQWRDLVLLNYEVPDHLVEPLVPDGTLLDRFDGKLIASVVGFRFLDTRVRGWRVPFHRHFEEVNLRFYVRHDTRSGAARRGVVFVRELVPKRAVAWMARVVYNEPYLRVPMSHRIDRGDDGRGVVEYRWRIGGTECRLGGRVTHSLQPLVRPSEAEFITEHYWGYTRQRDRSTLEYRVAHPAWAVAELIDPGLTGPLERLYGSGWADALGGAPRSAFYADGSAVEVFPGQPLGAS